MNLNKHTKAELISKINEYKINKLEQKLHKNNILTKIKSYFVQL